MVSSGKKSWHKVSVRYSTLTMCCTYQSHTATGRIPATSSTVLLLLPRGSATLNINRCAVFWHVVSILSRHPVTYTCNNTSKPTQPLVFFGNWWLVHPLTTTSCGHGSLYCPVQVANVLGWCYTAAMHLRDEVEMDGWDLSWAPKVLCSQDPMLT